MWAKTNPNPKRKHVQDCVIRAIAIATDKSWYEVYDELCATGREEANMPSVNEVWGKYLYDLGFEPFLLPYSCPACITVEHFCRLYPRGTYIIGTGNHAVAVINGDYFDSWDSGAETCSYYWKIK